MQTSELDLISVGQLEIRYLIDGVDSGAATGMFELIVPRGARVPPPHSHSHNEEIIYGLEGTLRSTVGDEVRDLKPGDRSYTPRGVVHAFSNPYNQVARALVILTPDIGAQYFRDIAEVVGGPGGTDPTKMAEVMNRYGLVLSPPKTTGAAG